MEVLIVLGNLIQNIALFFAYMMPFGIFDSISYFIDIYGSPGSILILSGFSILLGMLFLIYLFELFNIPINPEHAEIAEKDENGNKKTETFLGTTLSFVFGKSNFGTYFPKVLEFIKQVNYKLIPIFLILVIMYSSFFPTGRGYNTVGEFLHSNMPIIGYSLFGENYMSKEEAERILKYNSLKESERENNIILYKDTNVVLKELTPSTLSNQNLNDTLDEEVNLYTKVYNEKSFNEYVVELNQRKNIVEAKLKQANAEKEATTDKKKLAELIKQINKYKTEIAHFNSSITKAKEIYDNLNYKINQADLTKLNQRTKQEIGYKNIELLLNEDQLKLTQNKVREKDLQETYDILDSILKNYNGGELTTNESKYNINSYVKYINYFISGMGAESQKAGVREIRSKIFNTKETLNDLPSETQLLKEIQRLTSSLNRLEKELNNTKDIDKSIETRLSYIIDSNAAALANYPIGENENFRQGLLLLQYKLLNKKNNITSEKAFKIQLLNNKVEYIGIGAIKNYTLFIGIISTILTILFYLTLIMFAGWKNLLLLYISFLRFISNVIADYIGEDKKKTVDQHIAKIVHGVLKQDLDKDNLLQKDLSTKDISDPEWQWFENNKDHREIYMFMLIEVVIRFGLIYWFIFA